MLAGVQHGEREVSSPAAAGRAERLAEISARLASLEEELAGLEPPAAGNTLVIDDESLAAEGPGAVLLAEKAGHGSNPPGERPGQLADPGDGRRLPNASGGRYTGT